MYNENVLCFFNRRVNLFIILFLVLLGVITVLSLGLSTLYNDIYIKAWYLKDTQSSFFVRLELLT